MDRVIEIYSKYLGYRFISSTTVSAEQAKIWDAENIEGSKMIFMSPESSNDFFFRFIQQDIDEDYVPFGTYGWNAAELIVKDVDQSAEKLIGSPFEVIGEPADLSFTDQIRAMQRFWDHQKKLYILPSSNLN